MPGPENEGISVESVSIKAASDAELRQRITELSAEGPSIGLAKYIIIRALECSSTPEASPFSWWEECGITGEAFS